MKIIASEFDAQSWDRYGVNWLRAVKSRGYSPLLVGQFVSALKVRMVTPAHKRGGIFDYYRTVSEILEPGDVCATVPVDYDFKTDVFEPNHPPGFEPSLPLMNMVLPIRNLKKRVEAAVLLEQTVLNTWGNLLDPRVFCADASGWKKFVGYFDFLAESEFIDMRYVSVEKIVFNLYFAYFSEASNRDGVELC
mgnify:CR=1 FL=1